MSTVIGIVGPPCSGKSTVAQTLIDAGGFWIDADRIAKDQLSRQDVQMELRLLFGATIFADDGSLSRPALARLVFGEDKNSRGCLRQLEQVLHPRTRKVIWSQLTQQVHCRMNPVVMDVPLLLEVGWDTVCDEVWYIEADPVTQQRLLQERGWTTSQWRKRQANQWSRDDKRRLATRRLLNDGTQNDLRQQTFNVLDQGGFTSRSQENPHCDPIAKTVADSSAPG